MNTQISNLLESARAMKPRLQERAEAVERNRAVSDETIAEFREAGFFKILQPKKYGGYELPPTVLNEVIFEVASACGSTGWTLAVLALHQWEVAFLSDEAQDDIWAENQDLLLSSAYVPSGKVDRVEGGFELSGDWPYSSGCDHAQWAIVGGIRPPAGPDEEPVLCSFFIPRSDYEIIDDWNVMGLAGTGSKSLRLDKVFVPERRQHAIFGAAPTPPESIAPIFKIPFGMVFVDMLASVVQGMAKGYYDLYVERNLQRRAALGAAKYSENPDVHRYIAETEFVVRSSVAIRHINQAAALDAAEAGTDLPMIDKARHLWEAGKTVHNCSEAISALYAVSGAHTIFEGDELQRKFRDIQSGVTHMAFNFNMHGRNYGAMKMGHENTLSFI